MEGTAFDLKGFGETVADIRRLREKSLRDVSKETGVSHTTLHRIEHGLPIGIHALNAVAHWAKLSLDHYGGLR